MWKQNEWETIKSFAAATASKHMCHEFRQCAVNVARTAIMFVADLVKKKKKEWNLRHIIYASNSDCRQINNTCHKDLEHQNTFDVLLLFSCEKNDTLI